MTGTGTQNDPYIVDNWPDFVTAIGTSGAYVEFPEGGGTIDMDSVAPAGVEQAAIRCASINGNGWIISRLYTVGHGAFYLYSDVTISDLNFADLYADLSYKNCFFDNSEYYHAYNFNLCTFSGIVTSTEGRTGLFTAGYSYIRLHLFRCALNMRCDNATHLVLAGDSLAFGINIGEFCNIKISGNSTEVLNDRYDWKNSYFSGTCLSPVKLNSNSDFNVFNVDFSGAENFSCSGNSGQVNLINTGLLPSGVTLGTGFVGVTETQLHDAEYLASLGFPIATG